MLNVVEAVADGRRFLRQRAASLAVEGFIAKSESEAVQSLSGHEREVILMAVREGWVRVDE
ncbi:hypothetical protein [Hydrogenophaga sp. BPS33]|uniref:hypothetical protein n=1 Tax=Hydrogenophaga sp. BPS33 TaxID=2651974 RepID=UPI0013204175|nr:hypothetical protein [Hydrogenophaga sp. BPS33]QHE86751.1 hypothetical protein F9K07_18525 [Hydrogenophaga sp. BPS33]